MRDDEEKVNGKNIANALAYAINTLFTYGVGISGWFGASTNIELSEKYQSLVTPKGTAFSIWSVIFLSQAAFAIIQLLGRYRDHTMVQNGVSYWYVAVCAAQVAWTLCFGFEKFVLSLCFMVVLWSSLVGLVVSQYYSESSFGDISRLEEFWLMRFPFAVHLGWITAALAVNVNVVAVSSSAPAATQLAISIISLAVLHAVSVWVLFGFKKPNYTIACVLSWASGWIYAALQDPMALIVSTFNEQVISGVSYASLALSIIIISQVVVRVACETTARIYGFAPEDQQPTLPWLAAALLEES